MREVRGKRKHFFVPTCNDPMIPTLSRTEKIPCPPQPQVQAPSSWQQACRPSWRHLQQVQPQQQRVLAQLLTRCLWVRQGGMTCNSRWVMFK